MSTKHRALAQHISEIAPDDRKQVASELRALGRDDLADAFEPKSPEQTFQGQMRTLAESTTDPGATAEGQEFIDELKARINGPWTSLPGLLNR